MENIVNRGDRGGKKSVGFNEKELSKQGYLEEDGEWEAIAVKDGTLYYHLIDTKTYQYACPLVYDSNKRRAIPVL